MLDINYYKKTLLSIIYIYYYSKYLIIIILLEYVQLVLVVKLCTRVYFVLTLFDKTELLTKQQKTAVTCFKIPNIDLKLTIRHYFICSSNHFICIVLSA